MKNRIFRIIKIENALNTCWKVQEYKKHIFSKPTWDCPKELHDMYGLSNNNFYSEKEADKWYEFLVKGSTITMTRAEPA